MAICCRVRSPGGGHQPAEHSGLRHHHHHMLSIIIEPAALTTAAGWKPRPDALATGEILAGRGPAFDAVMVPGERAAHARRAPSGRASSDRNTWQHLLASGAPGCCEGLGDSRLRRCLERSGGGLSYKRGESG